MPEEVGPVVQLQQNVCSLVAQTLRAIRAENCGEVVPDLSPGDLYSPEEIKYLLGDLLGQRTALTAAILALPWVPVSENATPLMDRIAQQQQVTRDLAQIAETTMLYRDVAAIVVRNCTYQEKVDTILILFGMMLSNLGWGKPPVSIAATLGNGLREMLRPSAADSESEVAPAHVPQEDAVAQAPPAPNSAPTEPPATP